MSALPDTTVLLERLAALETRLAATEGRLALLEAARVWIAPQQDLPPNTNPGVWPSPVGADHVGCYVCGALSRNLTHYVCNRSDCPSFLRFTCAAGTPPQHLCSTVGDHLEGAAVSTPVGPHGTCGLPVQGRVIDLSDRTPETGPYQIIT